MKKSNIPTPFLILRANTSSEWDCCDFAIIHLNETFKKSLKNWFGLMQPLKTDPSFLSLSFYDRPLGFYLDGEDFPLGQLIEDGQDWGYLEMEKEEVKLLAIPESQLDVYRLVIHQTGYACFRAMGKHSSEAYWTETFDVEQVLNNIS